jgi:hypothetical protein
MHASIIFIMQVLGLAFFLCKTSCKFLRKLLLAKASRIFSFFTFFEFFYSFWEILFSIQIQHQILNNGNLYDLILIIDLVDSIK